LKEMSIAVGEHCHNDERERGERELWF